MVQKISHFSMAFSSISNLGLLRGYKPRSPSSFFDWNISKKKFGDEKKPQTKYHEIDLPFSISLVNKTFLRGKIKFFSLILTLFYLLSWSGSLFYYYSYYFIIVRIIIF